MGSEHRAGTIVVVFYSDGPLEKDSQYVSVRVRALEKQGRWDVFSFVLRLVRLLRQAQQDLLHGYPELTNVVTGLLKPIVPHTRIVRGVRSCNTDLLVRGEWLTQLDYSLRCRLAGFDDLLISKNSILVQENGRLGALSRLGDGPCRLSARTTRVANEFGVGRALV